ncbi:MAG: MotA/TolQ/ExbB proton channel family protein [Planctomycetes bacterium]|nr:MotA/TolQ/ExbB proton channel family protein [Planctomycetota bacterium]
MGADDRANTGPHAASALGIPTNPTEIILELRWWIVPFVLASIIAVWFAIERLVVLRRSRVIPRPFVERFLQHLEQGLLDPTSALELCEQNGSPVAAVFAHGVRKWGKPSVEVEQAIIDGGERQISQLRKHLRVLNGVATVTPLLGLLGTVVGMIKAFNDIAVAGAMGRPDQLAVGIAIALLTTAFGLAIAIPSLIMYMYLAGRVDTLVAEMDFLAQNVVQLICAEALAGGSIPVARKTPREPPPGSKKAI